MAAEIVVLPASCGWVVQAPSLGEPMMFLSGGRAESFARALAQAAASCGATVDVLIHTRDGRVAGRRRFQGGLISSAA